MPSVMPLPDGWDPLEALLTRARVRYQEDLERAVEAALQGGEHGVSVRWEGLTYTIAVDPAVPYGVIHEHLP